MWVTDVEQRATQERGFQEGTIQTGGYGQGLAQGMGEPALRVIAHELVTVIKDNVTVDWMYRDSARANIRRHVKRLLRKYGYQPDLQATAVQNVLQHAEGSRRSGRYAHVDDAELASAVRVTHNHTESAVAGGTKRGTPDKAVAAKSD